MIASSVGGVGRLLLAWSLCLISTSHNCVVLEVMAGVHNRRALALYEKFGFVQVRLYDTVQGPTVQARDEFGQIVYFMILHNKTELLLDYDELLSECACVCVCVCVCAEGV